MIDTRLLDTGPIIAYLDQRDPAHTEASSAIDDFRGQFVTTAAVVTESMYFLRKSADGPQHLVAFLHATRARIRDLTDLRSLEACARLMRRYFDTPMDFADATLIWAADALEIHDICTLDRRGFLIFRTVSGRKLNVISE